MRGMALMSNNMDHQKNLHIKGGQMQGAYFINFNVSVHLATYIRTSVTRWSSFLCIKVGGYMDM